MKKILLLFIVFCCFVVGVKSQSCELICNGDFELPIIGHWTFIPDTDFSCWKTTESDSIMEVWWTGFNGVPAYHGNQFIEMDANVFATTYQNFLVPAGATVNIGFAHRGRAGIDTMDVSLGPVGGPYHDFGKYADGDVSWGYYTLNYTIPLYYGDYYSIRFTSVSSVGGPGIGNFLDDVSITSYPGLQDSLESLNNVTCYGASTGSAKVVGLTGVTPYTYLWTPSSQTTDSATGLSAGSYICQIQDRNGCSNADTISITQPTQLVASVTIVGATCGNSNGSATAAVTGGTPGYTYLWSPSAQTTVTATGLAAGAYTLKVTDNNGCTLTSTVNITTSSATVSIGSSSNVSCFGANNGSATANAVGGNSPYTYFWNPSRQTTATATGLGAGIYTITVTDNNGCTASARVTITQPTLLTSSITATNNILCNGGTGSASVSATGGTPAYTYLWTPSSQTTSTATGLNAGSYNVKITDAHGCTASSSVTITQPTALAVTASIAHICTPGSATATATPSGGTTPYTYLWTPSSQTTATATGISAGTYTVLVTDKNNCTTSAFVVQPSAIAVNITATTNINCFGNSNGSATSVASGGALPYTYLWTPSGQTTPTASNLPANSYSIRVTDIHGCTITASTAITQPAALAATVSGPSIRCLGNSGTYTTNVTGGTGPYVYRWSPGNAGVADSTSGTTVITPPGTLTYTVTVTDAHGCVTYAYIGFSFPPPLAVSISGASVTCSGRTANICAIPSGGTGSDTYLWEPANLTSACVTVPVSETTIYTVTLADNCNVSVTASTIIHVVPPPAAVFTSDITEGCTPLCIQFKNLTPYVGGKEEYIWNFGDGDTLMTENPIYCYHNSGIYSVKLTVITDSGCSSTLLKNNMITVNSSPKAAFTFSPQPVTISEPTVQFTDQSTDAYGIAYRWWNYGDGSDSSSNLANPVHTYADTGTYCPQLIVANNEGCMDTVTNCLFVEPLFTLYIPSAFSPNGDGMNDVFMAKGKYIKNFEMYVFDRWGMELFHGTDINQGWDGTVHGGVVSQEDVYVYKIMVIDSQDNRHSYIGNVTLIK